MPARSERFTTPSLAGVHLHLRRWGPERPPEALLLHGGGANLSWWDHLAPQISERRSIAALDFRGHGDSDYPAEVLPGAFQRDLEAALEHLHAPRAVLIGHSMGAQIALRHAARVGGNASPRGLVLIEIARGGGSRERRRMRLALAARRSHESREQAVERFRLLPPGPQVSEALRRHVAEQSVRAEGARWVYKFDPRWFGLPPEAPPDLARVACPALVLRGAESTLLSAEGMQRLLGELPQARGREIRAAGHNLHLEQPEACLAALENFLQELAAAQG